VGREQSETVAFFLSEASRLRLRGEKKNNFKTGGSGLIITTITTT